MSEPTPVDAKVAELEAEAMARVMDVADLAAIIDDVVMALIAGHCDGPSTRASRRLLSLRIADALELMAGPIRLAVGVNDAAHAGDPAAQAALRASMLRRLDTERETKQ